MQKIVRITEEPWEYGQLDQLNEDLKDGYEVKACNDNGGSLEYLLEKKECRSTESKGFNLNDLGYLEDKITSVFKDYLKDATDKTEILKVACLRFEVSKAILDWINGDQNEALSRKEK